MTSTAPHSTSERPSFGEMLADVVPLAGFIAVAGPPPLLAAGPLVLFGLIIATLFLPAFIFMMPNFEILNRLQWLDTIWAIVVPGAAGAFGVLFMRQFFSTIPIALEESARIDGANQWRIFRSIILPNSRPLRLEFGQEATVVVGTVIDLGDGVTLEIERLNERR